jgi:hypothetical protein
LEQTQDFVVDGGTEVVVEEIGGYDETLETLPADEPAEEFVEEVVEEAPAPAPAPRPAPRPVANAPAAQRPAAAATKAPQGGKQAAVLTGAQ